MDYEKLNLQDGAVLYGSHLSHIEDGIVETQNGVKECEASVNKVEHITDANKDSVDQYPSNKAVTEYIDPVKSAIVGKADKSAMESADAALSARIDAAISSMTVDSEVQDIRVGADGTTYPSAGTAVRTQMVEIKADLTEVSDVVNKDSIPLEFTYGRYVNMNGYWASSSTFGCCIVDVSAYDKVIYKKTNLNQYIADIAFSKENNTTATTYGHIISGNTYYNVVEVPNGCRYLIVNAPVDVRGELGEVIVYGHISEEEKLTIHDSVYTDFPISTDKNSNGFVNQNGQWATYSDAFWMSDFVPIKGITEINVNSFVNNPYVSQIVFSKEASYDTSMICGYSVLPIGEHRIAVPTEAKYVCFSAPQDSAGRMVDDYVITVKTTEFVKYLNQKNEVDIIPIPTFNLIKGDAFNINKECLVNRGNHILRRGNDGCKVTENGFVITNASTGKKVYELVTVSDKNNELARKSFNVTYVENTKTDVKVLVLGDSTVYGVGAGNNGYESNKMLELFNEKGVNLTLIGTMGSGSNKYEGRPGWTIGQYLTKADGNAFIFDGAFNFAEYLSTNGFSTPDYVVIQLGINDMFNAYNTLEQSVNSAYNNLNTMINNILSVNSTIKVVYNLVFRPTFGNDALWGTEYGYTPTPYMSQYAFNQFNKKVVGDMQNNRVILCPTNMILGDADINDTVHPKAQGYDKIASLLTSVILAN